MIISSNAYLSLEDMKINAQYILDYLKAKGWTSNAICGMLGNMQTESTINPGLWESMQENNMTGGFGLVQWTPASKFTNWADSNNYTWGDINGQLERIIWEKDNNQQWGVTTEYPMTFQEFTISTDSPSNLAMIFLANYERPLNPDQPIRGTQANYWYDNLNHNDTPVTQQKKRMPIWMYLRYF